jgi:hypothetical protein
MASSAAPPVPPSSFMNMVTMEMGRYCLHCVAVFVLGIGLTSVAFQSEGSAPVSSLLFIMSRMHVIRCCVFLCSVVVRAVVACAVCSVPVVVYSCALWWYLPRIASSAAPPVPPPSFCSRSFVRYSFCWLRNLLPHEKRGGRYVRIVATIKGIGSGDA